MCDLKAMWTPHWFATRPSVNGKVPTTHLPVPFMWHLWYFMPQSKKPSGCCTAVPSKQILHGFGEAKGGYEGLNISICIFWNPLGCPHGQFSLAW